MADPKSLPQKIAQFQNDSFSVWLQKTNISADELGDLNKFTSELLNVLKSSLTRAGTVSATAGQITLTGIGTSFNTDFVVGDVVKVTHQSNSYERRVVSVTNSLTIVVDAPFPVSFNTATYENLRNLSMVSAINYIYDEYIRANLVKAIAMS